MMSPSSSSCCSIMLCFVLFVLSLHLYSAAASDCIALLHFAHSFTITEDASYDFCDFDQFDHYFPRSYPKTRSWNNGTDCCSWEGVTCDNGRKAVMELDLSCSWLRGPLLSNSTLFSLSSLRRLNLAGNNFDDSEIPSRLHVFPDMTHLNLSGSSLTGLIPREIAHLSKLESLDLSVYYYSSALVIDDNVLKSIMHNLTLLRRLALDGSVFLDLSENMITDGGNGSFPELAYLRLSGCNLTEFPYFLSSSKGLQYLDLSKNMITEPIPRWLWSLWNDTLEYLILSDNLINGIIPSSICQLSQLNTLFLSDNQFSGTIPDCISNLSMLEFLDVSSNHLHGPLPRSVSNCTMLGCFCVGHNRINDTFPDWLPSNLWLLNLQSNDFYGPVQNTYNLSILDLSKNNFVGSIPLPLPNMQYYIVSDNNFTGEIPAVICNATDLEIINLSNNSLVGSIPHCLAKTSATLFILNLRNNKLTGKIPQISSLDNCLLRTVDLSRNNFSGTVPRSLANCKDLEVLDLSNNAIEDVFPSWLAALPKLHVLVIRSNRFYGPVQYDSSESAVHPFRQLHIFDISVNRFSGPLPTKYMANFEAMMDYSELGDLRFTSNDSGFTYEDSVRVVMKGNEIELVKILKVFTTIDLSANFFEGEFPGVVGNLKALKGLNFSHNNITGNILPSVRNLSNLEWLDLSSNNLSGEIPSEMVDLTSLGTLNLSENRLSGPIPTGNQFNTFGSDAFEGNPQLCGFPLLKECGSKDNQDPPPPPNNAEEDEGEDQWMEWTTVPVGYIFGIVFGFTIGYILW